MLLADIGGNYVGRILYDGFGGVLSNTLPFPPTSETGGTADVATGLVHMGDGRWLDAALGRPLQPNPNGGPPTVPQALNRFAAAPLGQPGVYQPRFGIDDTAVKRFLATELGSELLTGTIIEVAFAFPELLQPWQNPYFSTRQRLAQNIVTGAGTLAQIGVGAYVGASIGGPIGFVVGVGVGVGLGVFWEYVIKPGGSWFAVAVLNQPDPYQGIRNLLPLGTN
jgi:hypothetical protein